MTESYFSKFPTTLYNNTRCVDMTRRVKVDEKTRNALTLYYTYDIADGTRADFIADAYYEDQELDWLLWMTNGVVDPYYQWNLSVRDFEDYLIKKYGSTENAIKRIVFYRNNWYEDENILTPEFYDNNLDKNWKKYYQPFYGHGVKVLYWMRREEDWVQETNKIYKLYMDDTSSFAEGDLIDVKRVVNRIGGGEVTAVTDTFIMIKNIDGEFAIGDIATSERNDIDESVTDVDLVYDAITNDEGVFWSPVTYYDIENERNAYNRTINILDKSQLPAVMEQLRKLIKV